MPFWISHPAPSAFVPQRPSNYHKLSKLDQAIIDESSVDAQLKEWLIRTAVTNRNLVVTLMIFLLLTHSMEIVGLITKLLTWFGKLGWLPS
jgi:hypothetical protein